MKLMQDDIEDILQCPECGALVEQLHTSGVCFFCLGRIEAEEHEDSDGDT